jgi:hypothetical protein
MINPKTNAPGKGRAFLSKLAGVESLLKPEVFCSAPDHISKLSDEIAAVALALKGEAEQSQYDSLFGPLTRHYAIGLRIVQTLKPGGWLTASYAACILGAEDLAHNGIVLQWFSVRAAEQAPPRSSFDQAAAR